MNKQTNRDIDAMQSSAINATHRPWVRVVAQAVAFLYLAQIIGPIASASAQVVAYKKAPSGQRPIMDAARNGVPIVNIAPPSSGGVSRNQYQDFNVDPQGLILNNSRNNTQTQLGGWIAGNPQMGATSARIILNEVVSGNPSQLNGPTEVAGQKAAIVVANPNGITCDGCGFLNTDRVTLTAGKPQFGTGGSLTGFNVSQGQLSIGAQGLNAANLEQLDLIARGIVIEGEVWSKNLNVIVGRNDVLYGTLQAIAKNGSDASPGFAIDIKELGGMYANQIYMVSTEQGLGVNSTGRIAALQGNLTLSVNGDLALTDSYAKQNFLMTAAGNITLKGKTIGDGGVKVAALGNLDNLGIVFSGSNLAMTAAQLSDNKGSLMAAHDLSLQAQSIALNETTITANGNATLAASTGNVTANKAQLYTGGNLDIEAVGHITNAGGTWQAAGNMTLQANSIDNHTGTMQANEALSLATANGGLLDNQAGTLVGSTAVTLNGSAVNNAQGTIATDGVLLIDTKGGQLDNQAGTLVGNNAVTLNTGAINNAQGTIVTDGTLLIDTKGAQLDNQAGTLVGNAAMTLSSGVINNAQGTIATDGVLLIDTKSAQLDNQAGTLVGNTAFTLNSGAINNVNGTIATDGTLLIDTKDAQLDNTTGKIHAGAGMTMAVASLNNTNGTLASSAAMTLDIGSDYTNAGVLSADDALTVNAANITNSGTMTTGKKLTINTGNLVNSGELSAISDAAAGEPAVVSETALNLSGTLTNAATGLIDGNKTTINANTVNNTGRVYGDALKVQVDTLNNSGAGVIAAREGMLLGARNISNTNGGLIYSLGDIAMARSFDADGHAVGEVETVLNASAKIEAAGNITIAAKDLTNRNDELVTTTTTTSTPINKMQIQRLDNPDVTKYDPSALGWSAKLGRGMGAYVLPSNTYPFSIYGSETRDAAYTRRCPRDEECVYTFKYADTDPIWALFGVVPGHNLTQASLLNAKIQAFNADLSARSFDDWYQFTWTQKIVTDTVVESTRPAEILAGKALSINASNSVLNDNSSMVAGGAINITGASVENRGTQGTRTETNVGSYTIRYVTRTTNSPELDWYPQGATTGAPVVTTTTLQAYTYKQNTAPGVASRDLSSGAGSTPVSSAPVVVTAPTVTPIDQFPANELTVPSSSIFTTTPAPGAKYLVETDPRFINKNNFLSSDYYFKKLTGSPEIQLKRYGDGFAEQQLINDQILALTGKRYLSGYTSTEDEYKGLMDAGIAFAQQYQISPGVILSAEQMALLTTDIVLLVKQSVTLPDGSVQEVLAPQVYLRRPQEGDLLPSGGLIAGSDVTIRSVGDIVNSGQISADNETTLLAGNDLTNRDGRISGQDVYLRANNDLKNISGTILGTGENSKVALSAGRDIVLETRTIAGTTTRTADTITSTRVNADRIATVQGGDVTLDAGRDMIGKASAVLADKDLAVVAGRDIKVSAVENNYTINDQQGGRVTQGRTSYRVEKTVTNELAAFGAGGNIVLAAGTAGKGDIALTGVNAAAGDSIVMQGTNVTIAAVKDSQLDDIQRVAKNYYQRSMKSDETLTGGVISAGNDLIIRATGEAGVADANGVMKAIAGTGDVKLSGAYLQSQNGQVGVIANNNVEIGAIKTEHSTAYEYYKKSKSMFSTKVVTIADLASQEKAEGSIVSGKSVAIQAGNQVDMTGDVTIKASQIVADNDLQISAGRNLTIGTDQQESKTYSFYEKKKSGMFSGGGFGITIGSQKLTQKQWVTTETNVGSAIGSVNGNVNLSAGKQYTQTASQIASPGGDINIVAQNIDINAAADTLLLNSEQRFKQSGLTLAISSPIISALQTVQQMSQAASETSDNRMKALAGATSALAINDAYGAIQRGQGSNIGGKENQILTGNKNLDGSPEIRDANAADQAGGINLSISIGASKSESKTMQASSTVVGSAIAAGGDVTIVAVGGGKDSDITVNGSNIIAANNLTMLAEDEINLIAAKNTAEQHSSNKSSSGSLGISIGTSGFGVTASASVGRGNADGNDVGWTNSHATAGEQVVMQSGGDTNIKGAVVNGKQVTANVGGDLNIESLQDTSKYDSKQQNIAGSVTIGAGGGGSLSYSKSSVKSDYASVVEQSGIKTGDDGFQVKVKGNTDLKGAVIASTDKAVKDGRNKLDTARLTIDNIQNRASYKADAISASMGSGSLGGVPNLTGAGVGSDKGRTSSTTQSGVSGVAGNKDVRTGDKETGIAKIFDADKVQKEINAQVQITQAFSQKANKAVGDYVQDQRTSLQEKLRTAGTEDEKVGLKKQLDDLLMEERALNILIGTVTGMGTSAVTKEALSAAANEMRQLMIEDSKKFLGVADVTNTDNPLNNVSGNSESEGVRGDGVKVGGTRIDLDLLCGSSNERCVKNPDGSLALSNGMVQWDAKDEDGKAIALADFLRTEEGKKMAGATGGIQGQKGTLFGEPYAAGSWQDKLIESFSGTHDFIGGKLSGLYDEQGNAARGRSDVQKITQEMWSGIAIAPATPFAMAELLSPQVWQMLSIVLREAK